MKPSSLAERNYQHLIVFGDPRSGKSTLVSQLLLAGYNLTWVSMDNGHEVIFKLPLSMEELDERLNLIVLPDTKEKPVAISTCLKIVTGMPCLICDSHGVVDCPVCRGKKEAVTWSRVCCNEFGPKDVIVFDHLGQLSTSIMSAAYIKYKKPDDEKPEWDQYAMQGLILDKFLTSIQASRYNVVCITHVDEVEMEDKSKKLVPLAGTTKFSRNTVKYFDHAIYCHVSNAKHRFGSKSTYQTNLIAGSRTDVEIEKMEVPSLVPFFEGKIRPLREEKPEAAKAVLSSLTEKLLVTEKSAPKDVVAETVAKVNTPEVTAAVEETAKQIASTTEAPKATSPAFDRAKLLASLKQNRS